jgi:presenilin-like A22 family membrane protease
MNIRTIAPLIGMPLMLIAVQLGGILLSPHMQSAGYAAFEDPSSAANPFIFIAILLVFTLVLLILIKKGVKKIIAAIIAFSLFFTFIYIFSAISRYLLGFTSLSAILSFLLASGAILLLYRFPEWYVIDVLGVLISAGVASIFGISLEIFPVLILLVLLAVYDAISVYKTGHMITLAESVIELKTPILVVIPKRLDYSYIREGLQLEEGDRGAFVMGMGDLIMPSILVVSANAFIDAPRILGFITIPSAGAILGSIAGLGILLHFVIKGKPQAGLPTLNGGAIIGFLVACAIIGTWGWVPGM